MGFLGEYGVSFLIVLWLDAVLLTVANLVYKGKA